MKIVLITALTLVVYACTAQTQPVPAKTLATAPKSTTTTVKPVTTTVKKDSTANDKPATVDTKKDSLATAKPVTTPAKKDSTTTAKGPIKLAVVEYAEIDLDTANMPLPFLIKAPVGSAISFDQGVIVTSPDTTFSILIDMSYSEMPATIAQRKKDAKENQMFTLSRFMIDKPDVLLYEVKYEGKTEYHFELAKDIMGTRYYLHDQWIPGRSYTQKQIEAMMKAASEAHPKP